MARTAQRLAIIVAIIASIIGYLYHAPNSEGIAQLNKVRMAGARIKIIYFIVCCILLILFYNIFQFSREQ
jgi:uncharacterized membrane protein YtjA (UPF0391 family)